VQPASIGAGAQHHLSAMKTSIKIKKKT